MKGPIWFLRGGGLGDVFVAAPALASLRAAHPRIPILGFGPKPALAVLREAGLLSEVRDFEAWEGWRAFAPKVSVPERLAREVSGAGAWISFGFGELRAELAASVKGPIRDRPAFPNPKEGAVHDYLLAVLREALGPDLSAPPQAPLSTLRREPSGVWIHPGSGGAAKNRPLADMLHLAEALGREGRNVSFALGEAEGAELERAIRAAGFAAHRKALLEISVAAASADLWIGHDSGLTHLAALAGAPTLALFQASEPGVWEPRGPRVVRVGEAGSPAELEVVLDCARKLLNP